MSLAIRATAPDFLWFFLYSFSGPDSSGSHVSSPEPSPTGTQQYSQHEESRRGSFRLFRSNSWGSRKKKSPEISSPNEAIIEAQRCSPSSYSTKSQDSGYSDNAEQLRNSASQLIQNQRLQFLRSNMEVREDEKDPNLTQMPSAETSKLSFQTQVNILFVYFYRL